MGGDDLASRVRGVAVAAAVAAVVVLGVPLAFAARALVVDDERGEVERAAVTIAAGLSVDPPTGADLPELPRPEADGTIGYYGVDGRRLVGDGPADGDAATARAGTGAVAAVGGPWGWATLASNGAVAAAPVTDGSTVVGAVRVATGPTTLWWRTLAAWAVLGAASGAAIGAARLLARRAARRIAQPMVNLRDVATAVGNGDLSRRAERSDIREVNDIADALNTTAGRLDDLLRQERALGAAASHQLRTPVMRLQLILDAARSPGHALSSATLLDDAAAEATRLADQLEDLLRISRDRPQGGLSGAVIDVVRLLDELERRHLSLAAAHGRQLILGGDTDLPPAVGSAAAIGHALDVLVDNALRHGSGTVRVWARETVGTVAVDVSDEGPGFVWEPPGHPIERQDGDAPSRSPGLGLELAQALMDAQSGRLVLPQSQARSTVTIVLKPVTVDDRHRLPSSAG